jgi:hypothetical protein
MNTGFRVLKDPEMASQMEENGYITLPFLSPEEVEYFKNLYKNYHPEDPEFFYKSYFSSDLAYKEKVEKDIIEVFQKRLGDLFYDHRTFGGMFVAKPPLEKGHFTAHQDWSFTDETIYPSYNMWCPLDDVNDENGNLSVLKGSHRFIKTIRGFGTPDVYDHLYDHLESNMISLPMKAGEVVIFYHGLVHGSTRNLTEKARVSIGLSIIHKEAPLRFHYLDSEKNVLEHYASTPEFYLNYVDHREEKPTTIDCLGRVEFNFERLSEYQLKQLIETNQGEFKPIENGQKASPLKQQVEDGLLSRITNFFR